MFVLPRSAKNRNPTRAGVRPSNTTRRLHLNNSQPENPRRHNCDAKCESPIRSRMN